MVMVIESIPQYGILPSKSRDIGTYDLSYSKPAVGSSSLRSIKRDHLQILLNLPSASELFQSHLPNTMKKSNKC